MLWLFYTHWEKRTNHTAAAAVAATTLNILFRSTSNSVLLKWRWMIYRNSVIHSQSGFLFDILHHTDASWLQSAVTHTMRTLLYRNVCFSILNCFKPLGKSMLSHLMFEITTIRIENKREYKTMLFHVNLWYLSAHLFTNRQVSASCNAMQQSKMI